VARRPHRAAAPAGPPDLRATGRSSTGRNGGGSSDDRASRADQLQHELEQGPCLDAIWKQETFQIDDMTADERYPRWSRAVAEQAGIRSSLSLQLFTDEAQNS
jgi:hypothetical protein